MPLSSGFVPPCLPTKAVRPPSGELWLHEIKHDGFRVIARKEGDRVRLYSRPGNNLTDRFPLIVEALAGLRSRSVILDGEAVCCDENGIPSFDRLRHRHHDGSVFLYTYPFRGFLPWRFSNAGRQRAWNCSSRPASENLHIRDQAGSLRSRSLDRNALEADMMRGLPARLRGPSRPPSRVLAREGR
ncbi:MAG: ATP-dependent DNA ligase, partial [Limisphaerales bacterium]